MLDEPGEERRYRYASVLNMRTEDLVRVLTEKARQSCPELEGQIDALAAIRYDRAQLAGQEDLYMRIMKRIEERAVERA